MDPNELRKVGPYPVRRYIAEGGMAWVFEVFDERLEIRRALKLLKPEAARGEQFRRFQKEARLLAQFKHDNLISVFDFGFDEDTDCYYYLMELVEGDPLSGKGRLPIEQAVPIYLHALNGLAQLHDREIVHRDIKPSNVIVSDDGRVLLADLGIARSDQHSSGLTQTIGTIGTYMYMSPEQAGGTEEVGKPSDVFSMGLSLYQSLVGSSVYDMIDDVHTTNGQNILFYLGALLHSGGEIDFTFPADFHPGVAKVISKACRFHSNERYADAREMYEALYEAFYPTQKTPEIRTAQPIDPKKLGAGALAAVLLAVALWQGSDWWAWRDVTQALARAQALRDSVNTLVEEIQASAFPLPQAVVAKMQEELRQGRVALDGAGMMVDERVPGWDSMLERATRAYQTACRIAIDDHLAAEMTDAEKSASSALDALAAGGAAQHAEAELAALTSLRSEIHGSTAETDCERTRELSQRLAQYYGPFVQRESEIANALATRWPAHLATLRTGVVEKGAEAKRTNRSDPVFLSALREADEKAAEANALEAKGEFAKAETALGAAGENYATASRVARMLTLRDGVLDVSRQAGTSPTDVLAPIDLAMLNKNWTQAEELLERALAGEREKIVLAQQRADAETSLAVAEDSRTNAQQNGADFSFPDLITRANATLAKARSLFAANDFDGARATATAATNAFQDAGKQALDAVTRVQAAGDRAKELRNQFASGEPCAAVAPLAQAPCQQGISKFDGGAIALAHGDAPTAERGFREAIELLERAKAENDRYDPAPSVTGLWPPPGRVVAYRGQAKNFKVQAEDARGDALTYEWIYQGKTRPEKNRELALTVDRAGGTLELILKDKNNTIRAGSWELVVENRAPELSLSPNTPSVEVDLRSEQEFVARASDADGEDVKLAFRLDGQPVNAPGGVFTFKPSGKGNHELSVIATDAAGKTASATRKIRVSERPNSPPRLRVLTPPPGTLRVGDSVVFETEATDPDGEAVTITYLVGGKAVSSGPSFRFEATKVGNFDIEIVAKDARGKTDEATGHVKVVPAIDDAEISRSVLAKYRAAYEARDIDALKAIRVMNADQQKGMGGFFSTASSIRMQVDIQSTRLEGQTVYAEFVQRVEARGVDVDSKPAALRARIERQNGTWRITDLGGR